MSRAPISESQAHAIFAILKSVCGAHEDDESSFVRHFTGEKPTNEWRFQGGLGFGGKFRFPQMTVDCYREDETPDRMAIIAKANEALGQIGLGS